MFPLVTVIMPAYNCMYTIKQSVYSILNQTMTDFELIIIDDGSSDQTFELLMELKRIDLRIIVLRNECNLGVAVTRNRAINLAKGEYVAFLDSDDMWRADKLQKQITLLKLNDGDLCFTSYEIIDALGLSNNRLPYIVPHSTNYYDMLRENVVGLSTVLVRRDVLDNIKFEQEWFHEDYVLWLTLLRKGKTFWGLSEILMTYRMGGRSSDKFKAARERWKIYRKHEHLSFAKSLYLFCIYIYNGVRKNKA